MRDWARVCAVGCLLLAMGGCLSDAPGHAGFEVTDSAGVEIVFSSEPVWEDGAGWSVAAEPRLQLGSMESDEPYLLDRVVGVVRLEDGRVAVANQGDNTIRFYDGDGRYLTRIGGAGEGPGEFLQLTALFRSQGRLHGVQFAQHPVNTFDEQTGDFLGGGGPPRIEGFEASIGGIFGDGSLLMQDFPQGRPLQPGAYTMPSTFVRVSEGRVDTLAIAPTATFVAVGTRFSVFQEFAPTPQHLASGDRFYFAYPSDYQVAVRDLAGVLVRSIRRSWTPIPVTEEDRARYLDPLLNPPPEVAERMPARALQQQREIGEFMVFPDHHPAFTAMQMDRTGHLWVQRTDPARSTSRGPSAVPDRPTWWDVFDPRGVWLGGVELPARFMVREIGADYLAGVWKNEFDVEFIRVFDLEKPDA